MLNYLKLQKNQKLTKICEKYVKCQKCGHLFKNIKFYKLSLLLFADLGSVILETEMELLNYKRVNII
jgi:hypothetical protein